MSIHGSKIILKRFCLSVVSNYRASRDQRMALFRLLNVLFWIISKGKCLRETFAALFQSLQRNHFSLSYTIIGVEVKASIVSLKWNPQRAKPLIFWIFRTSNCSISKELMFQNQKWNLQRRQTSPKNLIKLLVFH